MIKPSTKKLLQKIALGERVTRQTNQETIQNAVSNNWIMWGPDNGWELTEEGKKLFTLGKI